MFRYGEDVDDNVIGSKDTTFTNVSNDPCVCVCVCVMHGSYSLPNQEYQGDATQEQGIKAGGLLVSE